MLILKFNAMPWYLMSYQNQLAFAHMLNRLQNGSILRIGPFAELNFETFQKVNKFHIDVIKYLILLSIQLVLVKINLNSFLL